MMFFYSENVDNQEILNDLDKQIELHDLKLKALLQCLKTLNEAIQDSESIDNPKKITKLLKELKSNLDALRTNISELKYLKNLLQSNEMEEFASRVDNINNNAYDVSSNIERFIIHYVKNLQYPVQFYAPHSETLTSNNSCTIQENSNTAEINNNKVLFISEKQNKVVLPYTISELEKILKVNSKYNTLQEIIENEYTFSLDRFKNASISRFKEGYNLMRKKEKASIVDSLNLALELSFNNLLNPAVIAACKNLDELDIYLDCLDSKELEKFEFFEVKYEISPKLKSL